MSKYSADQFSNSLKTLYLEQPATSRNLSKVIEILRSTTEALIWSEQNNLSFFEIFEQQNILSIYSSLLVQEFDKSIIIQLLQSSSILIHNLKSDRNKEYLLRSSFFKEVLSYPFDFTDDEIVENYMSLLKVISVNVSIDQLRQYILDNYFTLFTGAMMFFNNKDPIIKTASRTVVLRVLSGKSYVVNEESIDKFILDSGFFYNLVNNLKESIINIVRNAAASKSLNRLESVLGESLDLLYHFNDIFMQNREIFNARLCDILMKALILPILASSIVEERPKPYHLPMPLSLYTISNFLTILKYPFLVESIMSLLFLPEMPRSYYEVMMNPPNRDSPFLEKSQETISNPLYSTVISFLKCKEDNLLGISLSLVQAGFDYSMEYFIHRLFENKWQLFSEIFINIIKAEEELRFFTVLLASKLLLQLSKFISEAAGFSFDASRLSSANSKRVERLSVLLDSPKASISIMKKFSQEWIFCKDLKWLLHLDLPLNYILPSIEANSSQIPLENRRSITEDDLIRTDIRVFFMIKHLIALISSLEISEIEFPLDSISKLTVREGDVLVTDQDWLSGRQLTKVNIQSYGLLRPMVIVEDPEYFVLGEMSSEEDSVSIKNAVRYSKVFVHQRPEPNIMMVDIDDRETLLFKFDDATEWLNLSNKIQKKIKRSIEQDVKILKGFIQGVDN